MSNPSVQTVSTSKDKYKVIMAILAVVAGIVAFYLLAGQPKLVRVGGLLGGLAVAVSLLWFSDVGRDLVAFAKDSVKEAKKVVWPTRKEAWQMTLVVFGFVLIMAIFLWGVDKFLEFLLLDKILGFKK
jgi:preprotein translocase subunit SecE